MKFIKTVIVCLAVVCLLAGCGKEPEAPVNIRQEQVSISGLTKEYKLFFLADSHISLCDERDQEVMDKANQRKMSFVYNGIDSEVYFDTLIKEASSREEDMVILGGDIIDSAMYASIEHVQKQLKQLKSPFLYTMGNHDFEYGSEYFSQKAYEEYLPRFCDIRNTDQYHIYEYEDLIIFSADDDNSQIDAPILEAYKEVAAIGKPIVLVVHVPIEPVTGDMSLVDDCKKVWGPSADDKSRVTMGINGCYPNPVTKEFLDLVLDENSPVELVLAGHIHFYHKDMLNGHTLQVVTGAALEGEAVEITLSDK